MAVVIRLQGLPFVADSVDIRHFFPGLNIPDGGVHIIGGKRGEAFIIFATDEDARRAMSRTGGLIKKSRIQLFLSSKTEMQNTFEINPKGDTDSTSDSKHTGSKPTEDISKMLSVIRKGIGQNKSGDEGKPNPRFNSRSGARHADTNTFKPNYSPGKKETRLFNKEQSVYLFLFGLPYNATVDEVRDFFNGLCVVDVIFLLRKNRRNGDCLVKFATVRDANAGLMRHNEYMGHRFIPVKKSNEEEWINAGGHVESTHKPIHQSREHSPKLGNSYGRSKNLSRSKSPKKKRVRSRSPHNQQFYVHLKNVSFGVEKQDIKIFFDDPEMADSQIKFLLDKHNRTREGFVMFKNERQYQRCLDLHKSNLTGRPVFLFPITRKSMLELIESYERQTPPKMDHSDEDFPKRPFRDSRSSIRRCIYVRNFPFDVSTSEIQKFFVGFPVNEEDIFLLNDDKGVGLGEALVKFPSVQQAITAEGLNRQQFLGTEVLLKRISEEEMKEFGISAYTDAPNRKDPSRSPAYRDEYPHGSPVHSSGLSDDFRHGSGHFKGSPERFRRPIHMDFGEDEPIERFDMGDRSIIEYNDAGPIHTQSFDGGSSGVTAIDMKNLPYTVTVAEILDFFYGYRVIPDSVNIRFSKKGWPTGFATVCIENYQEAVAMVNELNDRPVGKRKVSLKIKR
ncbi:RNA-binding protein 12B-B-like isoform X1 [Ascaphus truei]|uniref:RNA-binding protein 12B-B-like isoform X1 n=2 Tax=Ascaphus truei TaxID=8439 RepID=UPI003F5ADBB0